MPNAVFTSLKEGLLGGAINLPTDAIVVALIDFSAYGLAVTAATNATPIVLTTGVAHGLTSGDRVLVLGVGGNTAANGVFLVTVVNTTTFSLQTLAGADVAGNGAFTSGGTVVKLDADQFLADVPGAAVVATSGPLGSKTITKGVFDAADVTLAGVTTGHTIGGYLVVQDTGSAGTSRLLSIHTDTPGGTPISLPTNGGDIEVQFDPGANRIFALGG